MIPEEGETSPNVIVSARPKPAYDIPPMNRTVANDSNAGAIIRIEGRKIARRHSALSLGRILN